MPSTHGRVGLSAEQVHNKSETEDTPIAMVMSQELACRFLVTDTIRQTLVSRRSVRGGHNSGIEVWKLMREVGDMKKSLKTVTGLSQRGSINSHVNSGSTQEVGQAVTD